MVEPNPTFGTDMGVVRVPGTDGAVALAACPGRRKGTAVPDGNALASDLDAIQAWGAEILVSLVERDELDAIGAGDLPALAEERFVHLWLPIEDYSTPGPEWERAWTDAGPRVRSALARGGKVCVHCMGGCGRSGTVAARILVEFGVDPDRAVELVRQGRPGALETDGQVAYVRRIGAERYFAGAGSGRVSRRCLLVDHDDTAVMSTPLIHYPAHVEAMRRLRPGRRVVSLEEWFRKNFDPGLSEFLRGELALSAEEVDESQRIWREFTAGRHAEFFPGMYALLSEFKRRGGILVVVSHSDADIIARDYAMAGDLVPDAIFGWESDPARRKPAPGPVLETLARFALEPSDAVVLDDLKPGADMAAAAGVDFAAAGWGHAIPEIREAIKPAAFRYFGTVVDFRSWLLPD